MRRLRCTRTFVKLSSLSARAAPDVPVVSRLVAVCTSPWLLVAGAVENLFPPAAAARKCKIGPLWPKTSPPLRSRGLPPVLGAVAEDGRSTRRLWSLRLSCRPRSNSRRPCVLKVEQNESLQPVVLYFLYSLNWVMASVLGSGRRSGHLLSISTVGMIPKEIEDASNAARSANKHVCCGMAGRSLWLHDSSKLFRWEKVRPSHRCSSLLPSLTSPEQRAVRLNRLQCRRPSRRHRRPLPHRRHPRLPRPFLPLRLRSVPLALPHILRHNHHPPLLPRPRSLRRRRNPPPRPLLPHPPLFRKAVRRVGVPPAPPCPQLRPPRRPGCC